jgi:hypothetical protein
MKNSLLALKTRRTALAIIIADLQDERIDATSDRKKAISIEQKQYMAKLNGIIDRIPVVSAVVDDLDAKYKSPPASEQVLESRLILKGN